MITTAEPKIPAIAKITVVLLFLIAIFTRFFVQVSVSLIVLYLIFYLFWDEYHPPIILIGLSFTWLSISMGYFYAIFFHGQLRDLLWYPYYSVDNIERAYWYSIVGLAFLAVGIRLGIGKAMNIKVDTSEIESLDIIKLMIGFFVYSAIANYLFDKTRVRLAGISEFFHMLKLFKWSFLFLITLAVFHTRKFINLFWAFFALGLILSFTSFFSDFKPYLFILPIGYLTIRQLTAKQTFYILLLSVFIYVLGVYWSYIKGDYRLFLSGGQKGQIVVVSKEQALKKFFSYAKTFDRLEFKYGQEALFKRIFYLEFFSATIRFIPTYKPYMKGENVMRAIRHVTMPRIFFPNKPPLNDSKHTIELTGIYVAGAKQGVSISVGYFSELYADFGPFGMDIALFILGLLIGFIYKLPLKLSLSNVWGFAMAVPIFFFVSSFEIDLVKLIGDLIWFSLTFIIIRYSILRPTIRFFFLKK